MSYNNIYTKLTSPVDSLRIELFSKLFALVALLQAVAYIKYDFINSGILQPYYLFKYDFFEWVKPLPATVMQMLPAVLIIAAIFMYFKFSRQVAALVYSVIIFYFIFLEKTYFNNHIYLFALLAFLLAWYKPNADGKIPQWFEWLIQIQILIVYFYGGLVKINSDWLFNQQPMREYVETYARLNQGKGILSSEFMIHFLTYGGLIFDLAIPFLLFYKRSLTIALLSVLFFNGFNYILFNTNLLKGDELEISIFPIFMIFGTLLLFISPTILNKCRTWVSSSTKQHSTLLFKKSTFYFFSGYLLFQLLFPLRHYLFPGNPNWTGRAANFSWRMKAHNKLCQFNYKLRVNNLSEFNAVADGTFINTHQRMLLGHDPALFLQFGKYIGEEMIRRGYSNPEVFVNAQISLNGRPFTPIIDSTINLLKLKHTPFKIEDWILHEKK